jgi:uncharacterized protein
MPEYLSPGVYVEEAPGQHTITAVATSTAAFVGQAPDARAHLNEAVAITSWTEFRKEFAAADNSRSTWLSHAVYGFFANGGGRCFVVNMPDSDAIAGGGQPRNGLALLEENDEVSIVAAPGRSDAASHAALLAHCEKMGNRVAICDPPLDVPNTELLKVVETAAIPAKGKDKDKGAAGASADAGPKAGGGLRPPTAASGLATFYFPWLYVADPLNPKGDLVAVPPSCLVAGMWAKTDVTRGVHKAPANMIPAGALNLTYRVTTAEQAGLNSMGINCFRWFPTEGIVLWGARTLADADNQWRYINVRRLVIMIEESIKRATGWVVFEPNDRTLWKTIRSEITGFLTTVWRDGALFGATAGEAFFVKCDEETNSQETIDMGQVITVVGLCPVKPAEFVIIRITQFEGGSEVTTL